MSDLISRQDVIETFYKYPNGCWTTLDVMNKISKLPSVQKKGEWIKCSDTAFYWMCSECGAYLFWRKEEYLLRKDDEANFCPNCGADMRGEKDG